MTITAQLFYQICNCVVLRRPKDFQIRKQQKISLNIVSDSSASPSTTVLVLCLPSGQLPCRSQTRGTDIRNLTACNLTLLTYLFNPADVMDIPTQSGTASG